MLLSQLDVLLDLLSFLVEAPQVLDGGLLAFPGLHIEGGPERDEYDVEEVDRRVDIPQVRHEVILTIISVTHTQVDMVDEQNCAQDCWYDKPSYVMEEESDIHGVFLSIIVSNQINWLNVIAEATSQRQHVNDKLRIELLQTVYDLILFACMRHEVIKDDTCIDQSLYVELFLKDLVNQPVFLIGLEALELRPARCLKGQCLVLVLDLDQQPLLLGFFVQNRVVKEDKDNFAFLRGRCIFIDFVVFKFEAIQLVKQDLLAF